MESMGRSTLYWIGGAAVAGLVLFYWLTPASAADLGGGCCVDLEERIAELEATTAKKGNRKMSVTVHGQINKALLYGDFDASLTSFTTLNGVTTKGTSVPSAGSDWRVRENSAEPSFVGVTGTAQFAPGWVAGYSLEIGVGGFDEEDTNDLYTRRSEVFIGNKFATLHLGHASQATDGLDQITTANTAVVSRPDSAVPLVGPQAGDALDIFDGNRGNLVRLDVRPSELFTVSASWAPDGEDDAFDAAVRFSHEAGGFRLAAGAGYRQGVIVNSAGFSGVIPQSTLDIKVLSAVASVMHLQSGLFLTGFYGDISGDALAAFTTPKYDVDGTGWALTGGLEQKWFSVGKTTVFGEYGNVTLDAGRSVTTLLGTSYERANLDVTYWGGGIVQRLSDAETDVYATVRQYSADGVAAAGSATGDVSGERGTLLDANATVGMIGARVRF